MPKEKPKTREELDAELDAYQMKDAKARYSQHACCIGRMGCIR